MKRPQNKRTTRTGSLEGQLLIAMPDMSDKRFRRSVIYMCAHSAEGAMGLIINQQAPGLSVAELLEQLEIVTEEDAAKLPARLQSMDVHVGGPVETGRGFVLHSSDYFAENSTLTITDDTSLTATVDILRAMVEGRGPRRAMLALGYSSWAPGQLENELQHNVWLHAPADSELIFSRRMDEKYGLALSKLGVELPHLVSQAGHA